MPTNRNETTVAARAEQAKAKRANDLNELLTEIAKAHLPVETLEPRNMDSLDFANCSVWNLKRALEAAYEAGRKAR